MSHDPIAQAQAPTALLPSPERLASQASLASRMVRRRRVLACLLTLSVLLAATALASLLLGQYVIAPGRVWEVLFGQPQGVEATRDTSIIWTVRLPRLALALAVGAALAAAGALMQALFANPLAEPGIIGVSSGAAVGASAAIVFGAPLSTALNTALSAIAPSPHSPTDQLGWIDHALATASAIMVRGIVPTAAFLSGLATTVLIYRLARVGGRSRSIAIILVGIAVNAVVGAATSFIVYLAPSTARDQVVFWQMGSLNGAQWYQLALITPIIAASLIAAIALGRHLDVLALGEGAAIQSGVDVGRLRRRVVILTALLTAAAVCYAGIISFVGLVVPHVLRLIVGPRSRILVPLSALGGAWLVSAADLAARTTIAYTDLPIGIFTALVGGPTFFILLRRTLAKGGIS